MHQELIYQVDDINYEVQEKENRIMLSVTGKTTTDGWEDATLKIRDFNTAKDQLEVDVLATPPHDQVGIHDDTLPVLTDITAEAYFELDTFTQPIFSVTAYAKTNQLTKSTMDS